MLVLCCNNAKWGAVLPSWEQSPDSLGKKSPGTVGTYLREEDDGHSGNVSRDPDSFNKNRSWLRGRSALMEVTVDVLRDVLRLQAVRQVCDVGRYAFPDGTGLEVWCPEGPFRGFFVGFRVDYAD